MKPVKEAKRYAKMFISIVGVEDAPKALSELKVMESLMAKSRDFRNMLLNPGIAQTEKEKALSEVSRKLAMSEKTLKFMVHITENRVVSVISEIIKAATAIYLEKKRRAKAVVMSPVEISKNMEERLKASLKKITERDVDIEFVMDPTLLGGVLVKVGSTMYDSSIKGQLRLLKDELIKG